MTMEIVLLMPMILIAIFARNRRQSLSSQDLSDAPRFSIIQQKVTRAHSSIIISPPSPFVLNLRSLLGC